MNRFFSFFIFLSLMIVIYGFMGTIVTGYLARFFNYRNIKIFIVLGLLFPILFILGHALSVRVDNWFLRNLKTFNDCLFGIIFISFAVFTLFMILERFLPQNISLHLRLTAVITVVGLITYGYLNAKTLNVKLIPLHSPKVSKQFRFVQLSDVHIGSRGSWYLKKVMSKVNEFSPDFIVITGDLYDDRHLFADDLEPLRQNVPVFFVEGNHEQYVNSASIRKLIDNTGVKTLNWEREDYQEISLLGVPDTRQINRFRDFFSKNMSDSTFTIFLHHSPDGFEEAAGHNVDLMLSGHTHNGQIFPFNYLVKLSFRYVYGLHRIADSHLYVTSGTGVWGPGLRIGSDCEIVVFEISPQNMHKSYQTK